MNEKQLAISEVVKKLVATTADNQAVNSSEGHDLPDKGSVERVLDMLLAVLLPGYAQGKAVTPDSLPYYFGDLLTRIQPELTSQIERAFAYDCRMRRTNTEICHACSRAVLAVNRLLGELPELRQLLKDDVAAAFERDPAAESLDVILFCYPGIEAVATQRLANCLHRHSVPIIPRMWTERAHSRTGIDIHPGATIGKRFFIDHGTGVVIGESTIIGDNVSVYQGVTLGALSPAKGQSLRYTKRHPTIEDNVIIYAGATILGGETVIGHDSIIGGSVWLTESIPPGSRVLLADPDLVIKQKAARSERIIVGAETVQ